MQHAEFKEGNVLFDTLNCRDVKILETSFSSDDLKANEIFVEPLRDTPAYTLDKKHLYSRDEMSTALAHQDIDEILNEIRRERLLDDAPLLQYVDFHPDDITEEMIINLNNIEVHISRIDSHMRERLTKMYFKGQLESTSINDILDAACTIIIGKSKQKDFQIDAY